MYRRVGIRVKANEHHKDRLRTLELSPILLEQPTHEVSLQVEFHIM